MIKEITAKSLLMKQKHADSWFISSVGMNLYRGCSHNCLYCDGRNEKYRVEGKFNEDISVKINAPEILEKELNPARKRKPFPGGYIFPGGGVGDVYQEAEAEYMLTRKILKIILQYKMPVHILTKSVLVKRDIDIIREINDCTGALVSFSLSSSNNNISRYFEPGASSPSDRLEAVEFFRKNGIHSGIFLMPVIPFITDGEDILSKTVADIKDSGAEYMVHGGMTLKHGRQKDLFYEHLKKSHRNLTERYDRIYGKDIYGSPSGNYTESACGIFNTVTKNLGIPKQIPLSIFSGILDTAECCSIVLQQLDHLLKYHDIRNRYGKSASIIRNNGLSRIQDIDKDSKRIINEIVQTGSCSYYDEMLVL